MFDLKDFLPALALFGMAGAAQAATLNFSGEIDVIVEDSGSASLSVLTVGTPITGQIDDETFNGSVSNSTDTLEFGCCIAAGGLEISDNVLLGDDGAALLNALDSGFTFSADQVFDLVDIEGDVGDGSERIEVGVSFLYDSGVFGDEDPAQYPPTVDPILAAFFLLEEEDDEEVYSAIGLIDFFSRDDPDGPPTPPPGPPVMPPSEIPLPAGGVLLLSGLAGLLVARRKATNANSAS